ncbi:MAG: phosphatidylinositol kinase [Candidatus Nephrothrix sp. EaCA]|nr:MAG: phosphatidylinositol kinase [Candidatus Nephrothrix sp. EaCA]
MRKARVYRSGELAGILTEEHPGRNYTFRYEDAYFADKDKPAVSLTLPKIRQEYQSEYLFPFFSNMLSEGANRKLQSQLLKIDERDDFGIMLATAQHDTAGAVTVKPMNDT